MAETLGDLVVRIGGDTEQLQSAMKRAKDSLGSFASSARTTATSVAKIGTASAAAGIAIASGLVAQSIAGAKEISNLSRVANASASDFQGMAFAAKTVGIENEKFADILKDVNDKIGDFRQTGAGPMVDFFEQIAPKVGVTADQFKNLSGPQALQLYVSSLEKANVSQADMTFYMEAIASDATALVPLLRNGGEEMNAIAGQAERLGIVLSDIEVEKMKQASVVFGEVSDVLSGFVDQAAAEWSPVITAIGKQFIGVASDAGGVGPAAEGMANTVISAAGFVMDAVEDIRRTFEIAGKGVALFGLGVQEMALMAAEFILNRPVQAVNEFIEILNSLPGIDIAPVSLNAWGEESAALLQTTRLAIKEGQSDIHNTLMQPMPSTQFEGFVAAARFAAEESAAAKVGIDNLLRAGGANPEGSGDSIPPDLQARLDAVRQANMTELELLRTKQTEELNLINQAASLKQINGDKWGALMLETIARQQDEINAVEDKAAKAREAIAKAEGDAKKQALGNALGDLSTLMNSESKKMFKIGKAAAIANTIMGTYESAQKAYTSLAGIPIVGPALGIAAAGAAIAAGVARVQSIRSQQFGGGASTPTGSNTGQVNAASQPVAGGISGAGGGGGMNMYVQGINKNDLYSGTQLIDMINSAQENGARLVIL
jgi:hypothetical protein